MGALWLENFEAALTAAGESRKPILLEFIRPNCAGCLKMEHTVFNDAAVQSHISENFIPLRQNILADRAVRSRYAAIWTPSLYFLHSDGKLLWFSEGALARAQTDASTAPAQTRAGPSRRCQRERNRTSATADVPTWEACFRRSATLESSSGLRFDPVSADRNFE